MDFMLRCVLPDRPGALARLAGAISTVGGDIQAVDVVEHGDGQALDDLEIRLDADRLPTLLERLSALEGVRVIHAGPSRGHPGDAVTRLSIGLESLLNGSAEPRRGLCTLIGGLLQARSAEFVPRAEAPVTHDARTLALGEGEEVLVLRRDYRFTDTERDRAAALLRVAQRAVQAPAPEPGP